MQIKFKYLIFSFFISYFSYAQTGTVTGTVLDSDSNETLAFANVIVKGTSKGVTTDFEGKYELRLEAGTYTLVYSFLGFDTKEVTNVKVLNGEVVTMDMILKPAGISFETVVVTANKAMNTETALLSVQQKSVNLMDGISAQTFQKLSVSNVASAIKNVPGVSVQDAKYVYVRGLGDRYTKSILNGIDIPGLDPDRNTVQLDIFPTNIIDNVQIVKSFTADLSADFTGGLVNIVTKDFPTNESYSFSIGGSYNSSMHFKSDFLKYTASNTSFLGFDNGSLKLPISRQQPIPGPFSNNPALTTITKLFDPTLKASKGTSLMDFNFSFTAGNQYNVGEKNNKLGYLTAVSYKNNTTFYHNYETGKYRKAIDKSVTNLELSENQIGDLSKNEVLLSGLAGITFKTDRSKYKLSFMHIQNGETTAGFLKQTKVFSDAVTIYKDNLEYTQRSISNVLLTGKHSNEDASFLVEWKVSPTYSLIEDKDVRVTPFLFDETTNTYSIRPSSAGSPRRIWRSLDEVDVVSKLDFTLKHTLFSNPSKLQFGLNHIYKERNFSIDNYLLAIRGSAGETLNGNANALLTDENIWNSNTGFGTYVEGNFEPSNTYNASNNNYALYGSESLQFFDKLKAIVGLRAEKFEQFYTGENNTGSIIYSNVKTIDKFDVFPSANLIYSLNDATNFRFSFARTVARPSFKEASITQIYDPITDLTFNGNIDLQPSYINNFDVRYENFGTKAQVLAVSAFYKSFKDPIELAFFSASSPDNLQPRNIGSATVYGLELDFRKNLGFLSESFNNFDLILNASVIESRQEMDKTTNGEYESKLLNLRDGETMDDTRDLQGQSPYLVNAGFNYSNDAKGIQTGLFYNVQGKSLEIVGIGAIPDVYTMPFNSLNFTFSKAFGEKQQSSIGFKAENLLNNEVESHYQSYHANDQIFSKKHTGTAFSLSYAYKF
ncbi:MAG: TonB-dependent receptor [Bacteroidetes bacterium HGW-Bacteroidetes-3]|nr:MAG: TonB-dependent receptor [Bacteroidetes bacterium HGW-Bacteroidetes-3]